MKNAACLVLAAVLFHGACGGERCAKLSDVEVSYRLIADGITAEITTAPFQLRVIDGAERVMLESVDDAEGYANATWTTGNVVTKAFPAPGYFTFDAALERVAIGETRPDLTFILDVPAAVGLARVRDRGTSAGAVPDRFEGEEMALQERRRQAFLDIAAREPERCVVIDASQSEDVIAAAIWSAVTARLLSEEVA